MRDKTRMRAAAAAVVVAAVGWAAFGQGGLASAGSSSATEATSRVALHAPPMGPGGTWGQPLAVPGVAALATGGTASERGFATAVSCDSPGSCGAVGSYVVNDPKTATTTSWPLVVSQSAGAWGQAAGLRGIAGLSSGRGGQLTKVSCASAGNCGAAGSYNGPGGDSFGFLADEVNGVWGAAQALPDAATLGSDGTSIEAISCPSGGYCTAIGYSLSSRTPFILDEAGGTWRAPLPVPGLASLGVPADANSWILDGLSCPATGYCTATGTARDNNALQAAFVVTQTHGTWGHATLVAGQAALAGQGQR